jgi:hypothetical protein
MKIRPGTFVDLGVELHTPPNTLQRIDAIWAFVSVDEHGNEGLCAAPYEGFGMLPLIAADAARLQSLMPVARHLARQSGMRIRLIKLSTREELATYEP